MKNLEDILIEYKKSSVDEELRGLVAKLTGFIDTSLIRDIQNEYMTALKVYCDGELTGVILVRAEISHNDELIFVVNHVIAGNNINVRFSRVLAASLFNFVRTQSIQLKDEPKPRYFKYVRLHADTEPLFEMARLFFSEIRSIVFLEDLTLTEAEKNGNKKQFGSKSNVSDFNL